MALTPANNEIEMKTISFYPGIQSQKLRRWTPAISIFASLSKSPRGPHFEDHRSTITMLSLSLFPVIHLVPGMRSKFWLMRNKGEFVGEKSGSRVAFQDEMTEFLTWSFF